MRKGTSSKRSRAEATRAKIFEAALAEFGEAGFAGARVDAIARRSGTNKALLYRYFGDKSKLYAATLAHVASLRRAEADAAPDELGARAAHWVHATSRSDLVLRFVLQEAARPRRSRALDHAHYARQIEELETRVTGDAALTLLALDALVTYPFVFPMIARAMTGAHPPSPKFVERWAGFVAEIARKAFAKRPRKAS